MPNCAQTRDGTLTMRNVNETRAERNARIFAAKAAGLTTGEIARRHRLSKSQIYNITGGSYDAEVQRIKRLPDMIANTRRKLAALEEEARRYGFHDLLEAQS